MAHVPANKTTPFWTDEKHVHFLNTMEASFVRAMLQNKCASTRLDRHLPDTSDSTLDLKPHPRRPTGKHHAPSDSMGPTTRRTRTRRRSSQHNDNSPQDQVVPLIENEREGEGSNEVVKINEMSQAYKEVDRLEDREKREVSNLI